MFLNKKVLILHYFSYMYAMNDVKGLVQNLCEVKYAMLLSENIKFPRVYYRGVTTNLINQPLTPN